jgi:hypothetical protein
MPSYSGGPQVGTATTNAPGAVLANATPSSGDVVAVHDDNTNGSVVLHLGGRGTAPTVAVNANAGSGGSATLDSHATDLAGQISLTTGTASWATGTQATVTLGTPLQTAGYVTLTPANAAAASIWATVKPYVTLTGLTAFNVAFQVADSAQHAMAINYIVHGQ